MNQNPIMIGKLIRKHIEINPATLFKLLAQVFILSLSNYKRSRSPLVFLHI